MRHLHISLLTLLALASCYDDDLSVYAPDPAVITFSVDSTRMAYEEQAAETRAAQQRDATIDSLRSQGRDDDGGTFGQFYTLHAANNPQDTLCVFHTVEPRTALTACDNATSDNTTRTITPGAAELTPPQDITGQELEDWYQHNPQASQAATLPDGTRSAPTTGNTAFAFNIWSWYSDTRTATTREMFQSQVPVTYNSSKSQWTTAADRVYYWPSSNAKRQLDFLAIGPRTAPVPTWYNSGSSHYLDITFANGTNQGYDYVMANIYNRTQDNGTVPLTFRHFTTAVKIIADGVAGTLTRAEFTNVYRDMRINPTYSPSYSTYNYYASSAFGVSSRTNQGSVIWNGNVSTGSGTDQNVLYDGNSYTFYMCPQTLPSTARLNISIVRNGTNYNYTLNIGGTTWSMGNVVTYRLCDESTVYTFKASNFTSNSEQTFNDTPQDGSDNMTTYQYIYSYRTYKKGTRTYTYREPFTASLGTTNQYNGTNGSMHPTTPHPTTSSWLSATGNSSSGLYSSATNSNTPSTPSSVYSTVTTSARTRQQGTFTSYDGHAITVNGSTGTYLEDTQGTSYTTANCYIVSQGGMTYKFPTVYGNALKAGKFNTDAVIPSQKHSGGHYSDALPTRFLAHFAGRNFNANNYPVTVGQQGGRDEIHNADILNDNNWTYDTSGLTAELLWNDVGTNYITNVQLAKGTTFTPSGPIYQTGFAANNTLHYIQFTLKANPEPGNAVIALKFNGTIVWSWHIWVTAMPGQYNVTTGSGTWTIFDRPIGFAAPKYYHYFNGRRATVTFTQSSSGKTLYIPVYQPSVKQTTNARCTYYQWGRKDPYCPIEGSVNATTYNTSGTLSTSSWGAYTSTTADIGEGIKNPMKYIKAQRSANQTYYETGEYYATHTRWLNLWNARLDRYTGGYSGQTTGVATPVNGYLETCDAWYSDAVKTIYDPSPKGYRVPNQQQLHDMKMQYDQMQTKDPGIPTGYVQDKYNNIFKNGTSGDTFTYYALGYYYNGSIYNGEKFWANELRRVDRSNKMLYPASFSNNVDGNAGIIKTGISSWNSQSCLQVIPVKE